jgi:hypothetical protein
MTRPRLAAAAVGAALIAAAIIGSSLHSGPVTAATNTVEPEVPSVYLDRTLAGGGRECQLVSHVPHGADRVRVLVTNVTGGARHLRLEITDPRGLVARGDAKPVAIGQTLVRLKPRTRQSHRAQVCFFNPGRGRIVLSGGPKRIPTSPRGDGAERRDLASLIFVRPGSASWFSQTSNIAARYENAQTGPLGGWSVWAAGILAMIAAALAIWGVLFLPERPS